MSVDLGSLRHTLGVGWRAFRHRIGAYHWPEPMWMWAYPWEGTGIYLCARCDREGRSL